MRIHEILHENERKVKCSICGTEVSVKYKNIKTGDKFCNKCVIVDKINNIILK